MPGNSTGQSARWSTMTMPLTASVGAKRRPAGVPQALQACTRHDPVGKNRRHPSMRTTVQGGALLRCRRFSIAGRLKIGRASYRESEFQYGSISEVDVSFKKK